MNRRITPSSSPREDLLRAIFKQDKAMRASVVLAVFVLGTFHASPSLAAASNPRPCYGDLIVVCPPANATNPRPKPSKPKPGMEIENDAIDAGMKEARDKA